MPQPSQSSPTLFDPLPGLRGYLSCALTGVPPEERPHICGFNVELKNALAKDGHVLYLPQEKSDPDDHGTLPPEIIYTLDRLRVAEADFMILNADRPSFGVGQELEIACDLGVPVIAYYQKPPADTRHPVSRMVRGAPALFVHAGAQSKLPSETLIEYQDDESGRAQLRHDIRDRVKQIRDRLRDSLARPEATGFGTRLRCLREQRSLTRYELARWSALPYETLVLLEMDANDLAERLENATAQTELDPVIVERFQGPSLWVLRRLADALNVSVAYLVGETESAIDAVPDALDLSDPEAENWFSEVFAHMGASIAEIAELAPRYGIDFKFTVSLNRNRNYDTLGSDLQRDLAALRLDRGAPPSMLG